MKVNLAQLTSYKGTPSQSSTYAGKPWTADKAVDNRLEVNRDESTCSFTRGYMYHEAWWKLPLLVYSNVAYLEIQFRQGSVHGQTGFSVYVFNGTSYTPPSTDAFVFSHDPAACPNEMMNVTVNRVTKGVALYNSRKSPLQTSCTNYNRYYATIEICEVRVMGCQAQHYGPNCDYCDQKCLGNQCDAFDGSCIYGCKNSSMKPPHCNMCRGGFYELGCSTSCGYCKSGTVCNDRTGECPNGCQDHWIGSKCNVCKNGFYDLNCSKPCGHCKTGTFCNTMTGACPYGCKDHWSGSKYDMCKDGFYGLNCSGSCGNCKAGTLCNSMMGACPNGCKDHWNGTKCDVCQDGFYGMNCSKAYGHCTIGTFCNNVTGACPNKCEDHWGGSNCDVCTDGFHGSDCSESCGHCKTGAFCEKSGGVCQNGCQDHWNGAKCDVCVSGFYGLNCSKICGHCKRGAVCDDMTGVCRNGCQNHWSGSRCDVCEGGFYGLNCSESCGHCKSGTFCNNVTGICPNGCQDHWSGSKCDALPDPSSLSLSNNDKGPSSGLYVVIGVITTLLVVAVSVIAVLVYVIQKLRKRPSQRYISQPQPPVDNIEMLEPRDYDKLGSRQADEYMEIAAIDNQVTRDSVSNYVNETLR